MLRVACGSWRLCCVTVRVGLLVLDGLLDVLEGSLKVIGLAYV